MHLPRKEYFTHPSPDNGRSYRCARATATSGPRLHIHCHTHTHTHTVHLPLAILVVSNFPSAALVMQCKFSSRRPGFNCYWSNKILFLREDAASNCKGNFIVVIHARARRRRRPHVEEKDQRSMFSVRLVEEWLCSLRVGFGEFFISLLE